MQLIGKHIIAKSYNHICYEKVFLLLMLLLQYKVCDINCCCDQDCSDSEHNIFQCSNIAKANHNEPEIDGCVSHLFDERKYGGTTLDNLLCIVKTNLPVKRNIQKV